MTVSGAPQILAHFAKIVDRFRLRDDIKLPSPRHEQRAAREEVQMTRHPALRFADSLGNGSEFAAIRRDEGQYAIGFPVVVALEDDAFGPVYPCCAQLNDPFVKRSFGVKSGNPCPFSLSRKAYCRRLNAVD